MQYHYILLCFINNSNTGIILYILFGSTYNDNLHRTVSVILYCRRKRCEKVKNNRNWLEENIDF